MSPSLTLFFFFLISLNFFNEFNYFLKVLKRTTVSSICLVSGVKKIQKLLTLMSTSFCRGADCPSSIPCLARGREPKDILPLFLLHFPLREVGLLSWLAQAEDRSVAGFYLLLCCQGRCGPLLLSFLSWFWGRLVILALAVGWELAIFLFLIDGCRFCRNGGQEWKEEVTNRLLLFHVLK